jgi:hypothetical protein
LCCGRVSSKAAAIEAQPPPITATLIGRDCPIAAPFSTATRTRHQIRCSNRNPVPPDRIDAFPAPAATDRDCSKPSVRLLSLRPGSASIRTDWPSPPEAGDYRGRARPVATGFACQSAALGELPRRRHSGALENGGASLFTVIARPAGEHPHAYIPLRNSQGFSWDCSVT